MYERVAPWLPDVSELARWSALHISQNTLFSSTYPVSASYICDTFTRY